MNDTGFRRPILFLEFPEQAEAGLLDRVRKESGSVVALTPHAGQFLETQGIPFTYPEDHFRERDLTDFTAGNFETVHRLTTRIDEILSERVGPLRAKGVRVAWDHYMSIKMLYDVMTLSLFEVSRILEAVNPSEVEYFRSRPGPLPDDLTFPEESVYARVLAFLCRERGISCRERSFSYRETSSWRVQRSFYDRRMEKEVLGRSWWWDVVGGLQKLPIPGSREGLQFLRRFVSVGKAPTRRGIPRVLFLQYVISPNVLSREMDIHFWQDAKRPIQPRVSGVERPDRDLDALHALLVDAWGQLRQDPVFRAFFVEQELDWFPLVESRFRRLVVRGGRRMYMQTCKAGRIFDTIRPDALVTGICLEPQVRAVADEARRRKIPVIGMPHGQLGLMESPHNYYMDFLSTDHYLVPGEGTASFIHRSYPNTVRTHVTGWHRLDFLRRQQVSAEALYRALGFSSERKTIVLCLTLLLGNQRWFNGRNPSDRTRYRAHRRILEVLLSQEELQIIVKGNANFGSQYPQTPLRSWVTHHGGGRVRYLSLTPYASLLPVSDAVILEDPCTTLLETLLTSRPIYSYNEWFEWNSEALPLLKSRVALERDLDRFCTVLDRDLRTGEIFRPRETPPELLRRFGDPFLDQGCTRRIAAAIAGIAGAKPV